MFSSETHKKNRQMEDPQDKFIKESEKPLTPKRVGKKEYTVSFLAAFNVKKNVILSHWAQSPLQWDLPHKTAGIYPLPP